MAGLFARIFKQWAEEAIVNKLADNRSMQKAAVGAVAAAQEAQRLAETAAKDPSQVVAGLSSLWSALKAEASKDLGVVDTTLAAKDGGGSHPPPPPKVSDAFARMSTKERKEELQRLGVSAAGLFEKSELQSAARAAAAAASKSGSRASEEMK